MENLLTYIMSQASPVHLIHLRSTAKPFVPVGAFVWPLNGSLPLAFPGLVHFSWSTHIQETGVVSWMSGWVGCVWRLWALLKNTGRSTETQGRIKVSMQAKVDRSTNNMSRARQRLITGQNWEIKHVIKSLARQPKELNQCFAKFIAKLRADKRQRSLFGARMIGCTCTYSTQKSGEAECGRKSAILVEPVESWEL